MRKYTVKELFSLRHNGIVTKFILGKFLLVQNHIVDWHFSKDGSSPEKVYIILKGKHLARLVWGEYDSRDIKKVIL